LAANPRDMDERININSGGAVDIPCEEHDWEPIKRQSARYLGYRRRCASCHQQQIWRLREDPNPEDNPELGQWENLSPWLPDYLDFWTDGVHPVIKEEG